MAWYDITGTVADWVMAAAAVYAASKADDFFRAKKSEAALKAAITLYDHEIPKIYITNKEMIGHINKVVFYFLSENKKILPSSEINETFEKLTTLAATFDNHHDVFFECYRNIRSSRIDFKNEEHKDFVFIFGRLSVLIAKYSNLKLNFKELLELNSEQDEDKIIALESLKNKKTLDFDNNLQYIKNLHKELDEIMKKYSVKIWTADEHFRKKIFFEK